MNIGRRSDPPLTDAGRRLASLTAAAIAAELGPGLEPRVLASPARRCMETAAAIAVALGEGDPPPIEVDPGLWEIDYGDWDGLSAGECAARDPQLRARWEQRPYDVRSPGGESGGDVAARALPVITAVEDWLAEPGTQRAAVVVSHNHVVRLRLAALLGLPPNAYRRAVRADPGGYSLVSLRPGKLAVRRLNVVPDGLARAVR